MKKSLFLSLLVFLEAFILYFFLVMIGEYLLTERFLITPFISTQAKLILLIIVLLISLFFNYFSPKTFYLTKKFWPLILFIFIASLVGYRAYVRFYNSLQNHPKIYSLSSSWGIQQMPVTITGKNFGPTWKRGKVVVDEVVMEIEIWEEEKIVAHLPVPPRHFKGQLYVIDGQDNRSNPKAFEIRNPDFLKGKH